MNTTVIDTLISIYSVYFIVFGALALWIWYRKRQAGKDEATVKDFKRVIIETDAPGIKLTDHAGNVTQVGLPDNTDCIPTGKGMVEELDRFDDVLGMQVKIEASDFYTMISIGRRAYYFARQTGKFDGTGFDVENEQKGKNHEKAEKEEKT